jgi:hypothetical protein
MSGYGSLKAKYPLCLAAGYWERTRVHRLRALGTVGRTNKMDFMRLITGFMIVASLAAASGAARAEILINVDKNAQRMTVLQNGEVLYSWPVSTGRTGYATPSGTYTTFRMEADHYSKEWDDAPMPHSIFFTKIGHAIHGSYDIKKLGTPASHGCVRISPAHAATLFALVKQDGLANTKVVLTGSEQVALAQHGVRAPRLQPPLNLSAEYKSETTPQYPAPDSSNPQLGSAQPLYANRKQFKSQDYAQPNYVTPNYGFAQEPQYTGPRF